MAKRYPAWQYLVAACFFLIVGLEMIVTSVRSFFAAGSSLAISIVLLVVGLALIIIGVRYALRGYRLEVKGPSPADVM